MTDGLLDTGDDIVTSGRQVRRIAEDVVAEHCGLSKEQHQADHQEYREIAQELREFLAERRKARERWQKIADTAIGTLVVSLIGGVISALAWIGHTVWAAINSGAHPR